MTHVEAIELSEKYQLDYINLTRGRNGYPEGIYYGVTGFDSFQEAERIADAEGRQLVLVRQKCGWDLWESKGPMYEQYSLEDEDFDGDVTLVDSGNIRNMLLDFAEFARQEEDFSAIVELADKYNRVFNTIKRIDEKRQAVLLTDDMNDIEVVDLMPMRWETDSWKFTYALI